MNASLGRWALLVCLGLAVFFVTIPPNHGQDVKPSPRDEARKAVRKVLDDQVAAWNKGDLRGFMDGYWQSPDLRFFAGNKVTSGWQATFDRYRKKYQEDGKKMGRLAFSDLDIEILGPDTALVRGRFEVVLDNEKLSGLFTLICKKLDVGWRIVHDHTS